MPCASAGLAKLAKFPRMSHAALILITVVSLGGWLAWSAFEVTRFNLRLRDLWRLLESKGRGHRVKQVRDDPWTNLPQQPTLARCLDSRNRRDPSSAQCYWGGGTWVAERASVPVERPDGSGRLADRSPRKSNT